MGRLALGADPEDGPASIGENATATRSRIASLSVALMAAFACRAVLGLGGDAPTFSFDDWFFQPQQTSTMLGVGLGVWLLTDRVPTLRRLEESGSPLLASVLLAIATVAFAWAHLVGVAWWILPALALGVWAYGSGFAGWAGFRVLLLPGLVLGLALPLPAPIRDELVWTLQGWTAGGTEWLLGAVGEEVARGGLVVWFRERGFLVVEECSGIRGMGILTLVGVAIREIFRASGLRQWIVPLCAPGLGLVLNVIRVSAIATSPNPEAAAADHSMQGIGVLVAGTALLYLLAWSLATAGGRSGAPAVTAAERPLPWKLALAWWGCMGVLTFSPAFPVTMQPDPLRLPLHRGEWAGEDRPSDVVFEGALSRDHTARRRYRRARRVGASEVVDVFASYDLHDNLASSRLMSGKIDVPGRDWQVVTRSTTRLWTLGLDAEVREVSRPLAQDEEALVYVIRIRDQGLWWESLRWMWQLDRSPLRRSPPRAVVRLATAVPAGTREQWAGAERRLDGFVRDWSRELADL